MIGCEECKNIKSKIPHQIARKVIALVGNPNVGKTKLFNELSNSNQYVGNYPGITVTTKHGFLTDSNKSIEVVDLPGIYSLDSSNKAEEVTKNWILQNNPDLIINVIDSSNLIRNLFLTTILMEFQIPLLIVLNMKDVALSKGFTVDEDILSSQLGIPVFSLIAVNKPSVKGFKEFLLNNLNLFNNKPPFPQYSSLLMKYINRIKTSLPFKQISRWDAIQILENSTLSEFDQSNREFTNIIDDFNKEIQDKETYLSSERYKFIHNITNHVISKEKNKQTFSEHLDEVFTHKFLGIPIFIAVIWLMFLLTFEVAQPFVEYFQIALNYLSTTISNVSNGTAVSKILSSLLVDGIIAGTGTVLSFLPNIFLLFFIMAILEDSGYLTRSAFIMDKLMVKFGMEGRSLAPMIMGFGCNVPGIMATRNIEGNRERLLTILVSPFMSCSARLPIYILFGSIFFSNYASTIVAFLYLFGITIALLISLTFKKLVLRKETHYSTPLILEIPPYFAPNIKQAVKKSLIRSKYFIKKISRLVLIGSILIWFLLHITLSPFSITLEIENNLDNTLLGILGKLFEPIFTPLGFNWYLIIALGMGLLAKELIIASLGILYVGSSFTSETAISSIILINSGITPVIALSFMVFVLFYIPCIPTIGAIKSETNKKYAMFSIIYTTLIAYISAFFIYTLGNIFFG